MSTTVLLLAGLLSAADTAVKGLVTPADPPFTVAAGQGFRVAVPPLGEAVAPGDKRQIFSFYLGMMGADARPQPFVDVGLGIRVAVPPLGQAAPRDVKAQSFAFYLGLFR